ncbi:MAG: hypothetical protein ACLTCQ_16240 [Enterocloster bolteae]
MMLFLKYAVIGYFTKMSEYVCNEGDFGIHTGGITKVSSKVLRDVSTIQARGYRTINEKKATLHKKGFLPDYVF